MLAPRVPRALCALCALLVALALSPAGASAVPSTATATAAATKLPGRFAVQGAPLARRGRVVAGRSISVYARPPAVVVEGCRSRSARVRVRGRRASISVVARCKGIRGAVRVRATLSGATLRGTAGRRSFTARLKPPRGKLLAGGRSSRGSRAIRNVDALQRHPTSEVSRARGEAQIARTEVVLRLKPNATVGQVNAALRAAGGRIAASVRGMPRLVVSIPDPGSIKVLDALIAALARMPGVDDATRAEMVETQELPPGFASPPTGGHAAELSHLLAMRAPAAWNARRAIRLPDRPTFIIVDEFGNGRFSAHVDAQVDPSAFFTARPKSHGYHVAGIAAGTFANNGSRAGRVTGVFPARARMTVVDVTGETLDGATILLLQAIRAQPGRVVVNASIGHNPATDDQNARKEGSDWASAVRAANATDRLFHAASAGNNAVSATLNSPWVSAALRSDLTDAAGQPASRLQQTLAVENLVDTGAPAFQPGCLGITSNRGGNIAAVGTDVFSLKLGNTAGNFTGTSHASPQVAGLAEYIWSIAPDLTAGQVAEAITSTAAPSLGDGPPCNTDLPSAPRLDAYAAVLSLDRPDPLTPGSAPVRFAIMDRNGDRAFTEADLQTFVAALPAATPGARDWSRADLNGDGFTGGPGVAPFDLNPDTSTRAGAPRLEVVTQTIEGVPVSFDENNVSDMDVLCFYAYSGLYAVTTAEREAVLNPSERCGAVADVNVISQQSSIVASATACAGGTCDNDGDQNSNSAIGDWDESVSANANVTGAFGFGEAQQRTQVTDGAGSVSVSTDSDIDVSVGGGASDRAASGTASSVLTVQVQVLGRSIGYRVNGSFVDTVEEKSVVELKCGATTLLQVSSDTQTSFDQSGTIAPGTCELKVDGRSSSNSAAQADGAVTVAFTAGS